MFLFKQLFMQSHSIIKLAYITSYILWLCGLIHLTKLFVYHKQTSNELSLKQFVIMEHRLFWLSLTPLCMLMLTCLIILSFIIPNAIAYSSHMVIEYSLTGFLLCYHCYCFKLIDDLSKLTSLDSEHPVNLTFNYIVRFSLIVALIEFISLQLI